MRVLLIDDDDTLSAFVTSQLRRQGFEVERAPSGESGLELFERSSADVVLLDIEMAGMNGFEVLAELRDMDSRVPILMLTTRTDAADVSRALMAGADDYVRKPFEIVELTARLRALHRRRSEPSAEELTYGDIVMDQVNDTVERGGQAIRLTRIEFRLLQALMQKPSETLTRSDLLRAIWGSEFDSGSGALAVHVSHLRHKLCATGRPDPIQTVRGVGYRLTG